MTQNPSQIYVLDVQISHIMVEHFNVMVTSEIWKTVNMVMTQIQVDKIFWYFYVINRSDKSKSWVS